VIELENLYKVSKTKKIQGATASVRQMSDHYQSRHVILCVEVSRGNYLFVLELIVK